MGDWWFYVATITFCELANRVKRVSEIQEKKELKTWIQRDITESRLHEISEYVQNQPQHFFNAIVLGLFLGEPDWLPLDVSRNLARPDIQITERIETAFGMIRLSGEEDIFAIDGQHRVERSFTKYLRRIRRASLADDAPFGSGAAIVGDGPTRGRL